MLNVTIDGIQYVPANSQPTADHELLRNYQSFVRDLVLQISQNERETTDLYENMKDERFTVNSVECEGNLRAYRTVLEYVKFMKEEYYPGIELPEI